MSDKDNVTRFPVSTVSPLGSGAPTPLPAGKIEMVVTYLQMRARPTGLLLPPRAESLSIIRARQPTLSYYRYLYDGVGADWMWFERHRLSDQQLSEVLGDPKVGIYVLYLGGVPAGFVELDRRRQSEVEIAYFGLLPEFIGRGLGRYLLTWAIDKAFGSVIEDHPQRLWLHTCNFDHPQALAVYQRAGFEVYRQEHSIIDDPRVGAST